MPGAHRSTCCCAATHHVCAASPPSGPARSAASAPAHPGAVQHSLTPSLPCPALPCLQPIPAVLEIPSKDSPYDPNQDSLLTRVKHIFGAS
jgi:hypothetical protein